MLENPASSARWNRSVSSNPIIDPSAGAAASKTALTLAASSRIGVEAEESVPVELSHPPVDWFEQRDSTSWFQNAVEGCKGRALVLHVDEDRPRHHHINRTILDTSERLGGGSNETTTVGNTKLVGYLTATFQQPAETSENTTRPESPTCVNALNPRSPSPHPTSTTVAPE